MNKRMLGAVVMLGVACGGGSNSTPEERDVSGNYTVTYDNQLTLKLNVGGAIREVTATGYGNVVDFGVINGNPTTLDLTAFCAKPEVQCPSEAFWTKVAVNQPDLRSNRTDLQRLDVINDTQHVLDAGVKAAALAGLVNHQDDDRFLLGLGVNGAANANCAALGISLAGGRFSRVGEREETKMEPRTMNGQVCSLDAGVRDAGLSADGGAVDAGLLADGGIDCTLVAVKHLVYPAGAKVEGIKEGKVFVGWVGGCAFGPVLAGATLTLETGFTGTRTGAYDPPPFTPAPVVLPDGGLDGGNADAGP